QCVDVGNQDIGGAYQLHIETGIEHVRGGHARVYEAGLRTDDFREMREEGNDVVLDLRFDRIDACDVEFGSLALVPDFPGGVLWDDAEPGHGVGGVRLDLEPDAEFRFRRPDRGHLGAGVARNHRPFMASAKELARWKLQANRRKRQSRLFFLVEV